MIWVTGRNGMLGRAVVEALSREQRAHIATAMGDVDLTDPNAIETFLNTHRGAIDQIINCTAYTQVDRAESEPHLAHALNTRVPQLLAESAKKRGIRIQHISTDYVFDGRANAPYKENSPCNPLGVYGRTKYEGEQALLASSPAHCVVRTSWLTGTGKATFASAIIRKLVGGEELRVVDDQFGRATFCGDLARAMLGPLSSHGGLVHYSCTETLSWFSYARTIATILERRQIIPEGRGSAIIPIGSEELPRAAPRPAYSALDCNLYAAIANAPPPPFQTLLEEFIDATITDRQQT